MRLTLRTLLAYLDDTLEPAQARLIGQKVAESDQARELIERIQQVTRRRRITTPPDGGPGGKLDPNTLGEYLDNAVAPEQAAEVEEICLASDTHLAEVAACHQILTLVLGEPALVPPSARQRMYGLVKGPEAIPFRRPPAIARKADVEPHEGRDVDDTLRLGMPAISGRNRGSPWPLVVGGLVAASLLAVAVWQILERRDEPRTNNNVIPIAQVDPNKDKSQAEEKNDREPEVKVIKEDKSQEKKEETKEPEIKLPPVAVDVAWTPASKAVQPAGTLAPDPKDKEPAILVQYQVSKMEWQRVSSKKPEVKTGSPLVSLPASVSTIQLDKGLTLTLAGSIFPELAYYPLPIYESSVELHANESFDLDLTLHRGRIRIQSKDRPARVQVRFDNPTQPDQNEFFNITLQNPGTDVVIDRWFYAPREKFYRNSKDPNRVGPSAHMACVVLSGAILLKHHGLHHALVAPPGPAVISWTSFKGLDRPADLKTLPEGLKSLPPLLPGMDPKVRSELLRAQGELHQRLLTKAPDVALAEGLKAPDPALRRLTVSSLAALDEISPILEQLEQETVAELRTRIIDVLRNWIAANREHDYKLFELLRAKYNRASEAESILTLLHEFNEKELASPDTYDLLISYLDHPQLPLRELANWHLQHFVPAGQKMPYSATADVATRRQAQAAWRVLIPPGQLPAMPKKQ